MSLHPDIRSQAYQFFVQEAPEFLAAIEADLLEIQRERSKTRVHSLMRAAHSIKGGAANVGLKNISLLAHRLEDFFRALYSEELEVDDELQDLLLSGFDRLKAPLLEAIARGDTSDEASVLNEARQVFECLEDRLQGFLEEEEQLPTLDEAGVDLARHIFTGDVEQSLQQLSELDVNNPEAIAAQLRAQAEVFIGISELLNLPGLLEIARTTIDALDVSGDRVLEIFELAMADFRASQQQILAGDRVSGGTVSEGLTSLAKSVGSDRLSSQSLESLLDTESEAIETVSIPESPSLASLFGEDEAETAAIKEPNESFSVASIFGEVEEETSSFESKVGQLESDSARWELPEIEAETNGLLAAPSLESLDREDSEPEKAATSQLEPTNWPSFTEEADNDNSIERPSLADLLGEEDEPNSTLSLFESISQIQEEFEQLTTAAPPESQTRPKRVQRPPKSKKRGKLDDRSVELSVRIGLSKLDRLSNQLGEVAIARNSLSFQNEQLQGILKQLTQQFQKLREVKNKLLHLRQKLLSNPQRNRQSVWQQEPADASRKSEFDTLELDTYNESYSLLQEAEECIAQLEEMLGDVNLFAARSEQGLEQQKRQLTFLQKELMRSRMIPLNHAIESFPRFLHDLSRQYRKPVDLKLSTTGVFLDKGVLEKLSDPLLHLIRNAFDHGIEAPPIRQERGKSERGQIEIRAYYRGNRTIIEIQDDGGGIDFDRIRSSAVEKGQSTPEQVRNLSKEQLIDLLCEPGFSTATEVTELSGRGVGLDIVRAKIEELKGRLEVLSEPGKGTTFRLQIPLTLNVAKLLIVRSLGRLVALPSDSVEEIVVPLKRQFKQSNERRFLLWRERAIAVYSLDKILVYNGKLPETPSYRGLETVDNPHDWAAPILVLRQGNEFYGLEIEHLFTEQELAIKAMSSALVAPSYLLGCTVLADGNTISVLDGVELIIRGDKQLKPTPLETRKQQATAPAILVVDDSAGMRHTLTLSLEKAGYRVLQASHGREALAQLQHNPNIQLVICDIEMPVMNGFEFLAQRLQMPEIATVPVVMLTSRGSEKHRRTASTLGASYYFTKPYIESKLLSQIRFLLEKNPVSV